MYVLQGRVCVRVVRTAFMKAAPVLHLDEHAIQGMAKRGGDGNVRGVLDRLVLNHLKGCVCMCVCVCACVCVCVCMCVCVCVCVCVC